ncbi:hypothetical protein GTZ99_02990 [Novosphingobium sp. FSY-8]|uniref:Uncharacterized protein n=1 Tax=Novosphingobium ovatum TaxID=1908523 RepID=A0ABW9XAF7_9SPHN|nr:hypothetical protein [Novosphingobium ovatum]
MADRKISIPLDDPTQVASFNKRAIDKVIETINLRLQEGGRQISRLAMRLTTNEALQAPTPRWAGLHPFQRAEEIGKAKAEHDQAILDARAFVADLEGKTDA